jgi:hypothetical protein
MPTPSQRTKKEVNESYWFSNEYSLEQFDFKITTPTYLIFEKIITAVCEGYNVNLREASIATFSSKERYYARVIMYILIYKTLSKLRRIKTKAAMIELIGLDNYRLVLKYYDGIM